MDNQQQHNKQNKEWNIKLRMEMLLFGTRQCASGICVYSSTNIKSIIAF